MPRVLIIGDEEQLCNAVRRILEVNGYEVMTAGEGNKALQVLEAFEPDLVLTDIFMPGMEGLETIRTLASQYPGLPIVVMTGALDSLFIELSMRFGAVQGLNKPFSTDELLLAIENSIQSDDLVRDTNTLSTTAVGED